MCIWQGCWGPPHLSPPRRLPAAWAKVWGSEVGIESLVFGVWCLVFGVWGLGFRVSGWWLGSRFSGFGLWSRVLGFWFRVWSCACGIGVYCCLGLGVAGRVVEFLGISVWRSVRGVKGLRLRVNA